jgi:low temperature requirement protein LtrA
MLSRDIDEAHRASSPLELLFDLCFVVAVAQASAELHHALIARHFATALVGYSTTFFAIWWAWVNFTWFASAYDTDDVLYRLLTFVQIVGVLVLAAGIPGGFGQGSSSTVVVGYVIMRVALVAQWLRAGHDEPASRGAAHRYALGVSVLQLGWIATLFVSGPMRLGTFVALAALELAVPAWAESSGRTTGWHARHIDERYGLFTLIVLGEAIGAATLAVQTSITAHGSSADVLAVAGGGLVLVFAVWWWYFQCPAHERLRHTRSAAFEFGYGHYFVFGSLAAIGAGLTVATETVTHPAELSRLVASCAIAVPVAVFLIASGTLHARLDLGQAVSSATVAVATVLVLAAGLLVSVLTLPGSVVAIGLVVAGLVALEVVTANRRAGESLPAPAD